MGYARDDLPGFSKTPAACDRNLPAGECLEWHIRPHLAKAEIYRGDAAKGFGDGYSARCPAHDDGHASFTISVGLRCIWYQCHGNCDQLAVRAALIRQGVPAECLPVSRERKAELVDQLVGVLASPDIDHGHARMLALALARGMPGLPKGRELEALAAEAGVSRSRAFDYRRETLQATSRSYTPKKPEPEHSSSPRRVAPPKKSDSRTESDGRTQKSPIIGPNRAKRKAA